MTYTLAGGRGTLTVNADGTGTVRDLAGTVGTVTTDRPEAVGRLERHTATAPAYVVVACERTNR